ncbi:MAG: T9SS type A sorting domain-containing protein [Candidatus Eisenbacteria bacterium]|nr:T9SS type A sorting domain-containing protein [Candidatus Eisenbacteria bacterium]
MIRIPVVTLMLGLGLGLAPARDLASTDSWPSDPAVNLLVCTAPGSQEIPRIAVDGQGGAFIVWQDYRSPTGYADIYAQHVTALGSLDPLWPDSGLAVCTASDYQDVPDVAFDGATAVMAWIDSRVPMTARPFAQRVARDGQALWQSDGIPLTQRDDALGKLVVVPDDQGGTIALWDNLADGYGDIYAQRISLSGALQWGSAAPVCVAEGYQVINSAIPDGSGGVFAAWFDRPPGTWGRVRVQHLSPAGAPLWDPRGVPACSLFDSQGLPEVSPDGQGGIYVTWEDYRGLAQYPDVYMAHVTSSGTPDSTWPAGGLPVDTVGFAAADPRLVPDGAGGVLVSWMGVRVAGGGVYGQHVTAAGAQLWPEGGLRLTPGALGFRKHRAVTDDAGGMIVVWEEAGQGQTFHPYAQRVSGSGTLLWGAGIALSTAVNDLYGNMNPSAVADGAGGALVAWQDQRNGAYDIYAQNVNADGTLGGVVVDVLVSLVDVLVRPGSVRIRWYASAGPFARATVQRTLDAADWTAVGEIAADGTGQLSFVDESVLPGARYGYRLVATRDGRNLTSEPVWVDVPSRVGFQLAPPRPNPLSDHAVVRFALPTAEQGDLALYDVSGRRVATLASGAFEAGTHELLWKARDITGNPLRSGVYLLRLRAGRDVLTTRVVIFE